MRKLQKTIYLLSPNRYLSLDGENVKISEDGEEKNRVPLHVLQSIVAFGASGASPALLGKCVSMGISVSFFSRTGKFLYRAEGTISGNVLLRREQYRLADDPEKSLEIARNMILGKIYNSRYVLERTIRDHAMRIDTEQFRRKSAFLLSSAKKCLSVQDMDELRGIEGEAASVYFSTFDDMILQQKENFQFHTRSKRPPLDYVNAMLSFSYSLMTGMCTSALEAVGLDPYVGFMHTDRPGRKSLSLDLVEEFRALICDRFVLTMINKKMVTEKDFEKREDGAVFLNDAGRQAFLKVWETRKTEQIQHPFLKEKVERGLLPYVQALLLSRNLRGDLDSYPVFMWK